MALLEQSCSCTLTVGQFTKKTLACKLVLDDRHTVAYWERRARPYLQSRREALAVSGTNQPLAVARQLWRLDERGMRQVLRYLPDVGTVLDAGCGPGRWFHLTAPGRTLVGVDFSPSMVERARERHPGVEVRVGDLRDLPVPTEGFDGAYTAKVIQCVPSDQRKIAVSELLRCLVPGGTLVLFEKIRGPDGSLPRDWIAWATEAGGSLVTWQGTEYLPLDRVLLAAVAQLRGAISRGSGERGSVPEGVTTHEPLRSRWGSMFALYGHLRGAALRISLPLERPFARLLPSDAATHGIFVFRK